MTLDSDSVPQWHDIINKFCPRCCKSAKHNLIALMGSFPSARKGMRGNTHIAMYQCQTIECNQRVELEEFAPGDWVNMPMFGDINSGF